MFYANNQTYLNDMCAECTYIGTIKQAINLMSYITVIRIIVNESVMSTSKPRFFHVSNVFVSRLFH